MPADWHKIKHAYITGNISQRELAKKYGIGTRELARHSKEEEWVRLREDYRNKAAARRQQKTLEKITDKDAEQAAKIKDVTTQLLAAVIKAAAELDVVDLRQKKQVKKIEDKGKGLREEQTITKEYIERAPAAVDVQRVQNITTALKNIIEIDAMLGGKKVDESKAFDELMALIGESNAAE